MFTCVSYSSPRLCYPIRIDREKCLCENTNKKTFSCFNTILWSLQLQISNSSFIFSKCKTLPQGGDSPRYRSCWVVPLNRVWSLAILILEQGDINWSFLVLILPAFGFSLKYPGCTFLNSSLKPWYQCAALSGQSSKMTRHFWSETGSEFQGLSGSSTSPPYYLNGAILMASLPTHQKTFISYKLICKIISVF